MKYRIARALLAMLSLTLVTGSPARAATIANVEITADFSFLPQVVTILPGDTVRWSNDTTFTHSVTDEGCVEGGGPCEFDTTVAPHLTLDRTFDVPGIYPYRCKIHNFTGTIEVVDPSGALPDLTVDSVSVETASTTAPNTQRITAVVRNLSGDAAADKSKVYFEYLYHGSWISIGTPLTNPVAPGTSQQVTLLWNTTTKIGDFAVRATADGADTVAESDETNNSMQIEASIVTPPGLVQGIDVQQPV